MTNALARELTTLLEHSDASHRSRTIAAMLAAALYARKTGLPPPVAAAMIVDMLTADRDRLPKP